MALPVPQQQPQASPLGTPRTNNSQSELYTHTQLPIKTEKVWVGVRIRPLLSHEREAKETGAWTATGPGILTCLTEERSAYQQSSYQYDRVFGESTTSEEVYKAAAQPMVQSAMKGYNCTLFAYGQTGSGKTTTMRSVMRHAAKDIFEWIAHSRDREFMLKMCAIEVYNEVVHDLFVDTDTNLRINDDKDKGPVVMELTELSIESENHLLKMLKAVEGRRQVRETKMNQKSSRSHLVVRLYVESRAAPLSAVEETDDELMSEDSSTFGEEIMRHCDSLKSMAPVLSTINFVDLAGSERLSQASMTDDMDREKMRQKEASNINVSLLTLGKVIRALGKRGEHVPYRESNLTRILQPSLSGNSRMAIVCTLSPASGSVENSRAALHFANHAKAVTMRPVMNEVRSEQALIHKMEAEIMELRRRLDNSSNRQLLKEKDAQLKAKEDQVRQALQEHDALKRRVTQMEKFIIRGGTTSPAPAMRRSFDGLESLTSSLASGFTGRGLGALGVGVGVRASWTPTISPLDARERLSAGKTGKGSGRPVGTPNRLLLDCMLPPNVRDAVNRLRSDHEVYRMAASPGTGKSAQASDFGTPQSAYNLRLEIGKMQAPDGHKAREALSALQAEVRYLSQQPEAAAAVAAAAGATPDTADQLLGQLNQMLRTMEQRQQDAQAAASQQAEAEAAGPSASGGGTAQAVSPRQQEQRKQPQQQQQQPVFSEADANAIAYLRAEVARLERLAETTLQTKLAMDGLLRRVAVWGQPGVGNSAMLDGMPSVVKRLQNALQEADALDEGEEALGATGGGVVHAHGDGTAGEQRVVNNIRTPLQEKGLLEDDGEATSAPRYDSPSASAPSATAATTVAIFSSPSRLTGSKLPRNQLYAVGEEDDCIVLCKSPRRSLTASPHCRPSGTTPNSRLQLTSTTSGGVEPFQVHQAPAARTEPDQHRGADSPHPGADMDDAGLRRMRTPSLSVHASDIDPMSGGRRTASASSRGGLLRCDTDRAKRIISREKDAIHAWYSAEVDRLKATFHEQAQADVDAMQEAVAKYRAMFEETQERVERLNVQKQLLMKQVLHLEVELMEAEQHEAQRIREITALKEELHRAHECSRAAQEMARQAQMQAHFARAAAEAEQQNAPSVPAGDPDGMDDWAGTPTSTALLASICELWHKLYVPLVYRSRFFMQFRCRELLYLQMEQCRLRNRLEQMEKETDYLGRSKPLEKAKRALELEWKVLAQGLRLAYSDREREALYKAWEVPPEKKERKMRLVKKLWEPEYTRDEAGMEMCATVVCMLAGPDATEQFVQLVFGNSAEVCARPTQVGALVSTLVRRVATPRMRKSTSMSAAVSSLTASSSGFPANSGQTSVVVTPRRQSNSLLASISGRIGSFVGQPGQPGKPGGGPPPTTMGSVSAAATPQKALQASNFAPTASALQMQLTTASGLGPMARGLANSGAFGNGVPPLPPAHPTSMIGLGAQGGAVSYRGRATYMGGGLKH